MNKKKSPKVAVAQIAPVPGDLRRNCAAMIADIDQAKQQGADIIVFPELVTSGYLLGDRWEHTAFIEEIQMHDEAIRRASTGIVVIWGSVKSDPKKIGEDGRLRKYNAARIASGGEWVSNGTLVGWIPKTNLPKYRIFDDARHFYPGDKLAAEMNIPLEVLLRRFPVNLGGREFYLALAVCEDLWEDEYAAKLSRIYGAQHADLIIDISASPWTQGKYRARDRMLENRVKDSGAPILYVNRTGLENNVKNFVWFDGDSALIGADGAFTWRAPQHEPGLFYFNLEASAPKFFPKRLEGIADIHAALIHAIRAFFGPSGVVIIGLSGGVDSAVSAALLVEALGADRVIAVNMPTKFNSHTTQDLAKLCAERLGIKKYHVVPIQDIVDMIAKTVVDAGFAQPTGLSFENLQARTRGADIQALLAQMYGGRFICNGNKTEMALNYFTLYGDGAGAAAFLADLWKGQVYDLARFINAKNGHDVIPQGIISIVPSAELSAEQNVDEGKGDPIFYPYHDKLLLAFAETRWDPTTVLEHALAGDLEEKLGCGAGTLRKYFPTRAKFIENLEWCWSRYNLEFKRAQTPPVFLTSRRAFGFDRRDTIAAGYLTEAYERMKIAYLAHPLELF